LADLQEIFNLNSGTWSYGASCAGTNSVTGVSYRYYKTDKITANSNTATTAKFVTVALTSGDTNPEASGAFGIFRTVDSKGTQTQYTSNYFYATPLDGVSKTATFNYTADVQNLYTDLDVFASKYGVTATLAAIHRDKVAYQP
jgi:hypothetical protein